MKSEPNQITSHFKEYRNNAESLLELMHPGDDYILNKAKEAERKSDLSIASNGPALDGYIPAKDQACHEFLLQLDSERSNIKELASLGRLPFIAIEFYQEISRRFYGFHREGGNSSIYDEQVITNDVMAMKESLVVQGDYQDKSVRIDRSISTTTNIQNASVESNDYTEERIKKELLKYILSCDGEAASRIEIMSHIPVKESQIIAALEHLQVSGNVKIANRASGEIVYIIDRLV